MLLVLIFSLYGWLNNLVAYTTYKSVQTGPLRPIFTFVQIFLEGLFVFHLLKNGDTRIHYPIVSIFFVFLFILMNNYSRIAWIIIRKLLSRKFNLILLKMAGLLTCVFMFAFPKKIFSDIEVLHEAL